MEKDENYYFESASAPEAITHMAIPLMLGMCINTLYSITDAFYIGLLNQTAMLAAVALTLPFTTILMAIGNIFGTGGGTFISRLLGEKALEKARTVASVTFYLSLILGSIFMVLAGLLLQPILQVLGTDPGTFRFTRDFIVIFIIGSPFVIANFALEQVVRAEGASLISMYGMIISVVANLILDPILIFGFNLGISGAAIATVTANVCAVAYYVWYLEKKSSLLSGFFRRFNPEKSMVTEIFSIGISAFLLDMFLIVTALVLNNFSAPYGDFIIAGFGISLRVVQISELIAMGLCMGIVPLIAYSYASKNFPRMKEIIRTTAIYMAILIIALSLIMFRFRTEIMQMFSQDPAVINMGISILTAMLISSVFAGFSGLFINLFQAIGKSKEATLMSIVHGSLFIPVIFFGNLFFGLNGIVWSLTITEVLTCTTGGVLWFRIKQEISKEMLKVGETGGNSCHI